MHFVDDMDKNEVHYLKGFQCDCSIMIKKCK